MSGALSDLENIRWSWLGQGTKRGNYRYYEQAKVQRLNDGSSRIFSVGDTVFVANAEGQAWVAHLLDMCQIGDVDDEDVQLVEPSSIDAQARMACTLRWFYNADDETITESKRASPHIPSPLRDEIYFSDHVETPHSNALEVIEGRAFLCASESDMRDIRMNLPHEYWAGDEIRLVRCFYGCNASNVPPIRELEKGELQMLLKNPSSDPHLYDRKQMRIYGPHGSVLKGTGKKKNSQLRDELRGSSSRKRREKPSSSRREDRSEGHRIPRRLETEPDSNDGPDPMPEVSKYKERPRASSSTSLLPSESQFEKRPLYPLQERSSRNKIVFSSSDEEFVLEPQAPPQQRLMADSSSSKTAKEIPKKKRKRKKKPKKKKVPTVAEEVRPIRRPDPPKPIRLRSAPVQRKSIESEGERSERQSGHAEPVNLPYVPAIEPVQGQEPSLEQSPGAASKIASDTVAPSQPDTGVASCDEHKEAWADFQAQLALGTNYQREEFLKKMPALIKHLRREMIQRGKTFFLGESETRAIAEVAAQRVFSKRSASRINVSASESKLNVDE